MRRIHVYRPKKVKNPCVKNSSCVGVRKNDGVEIIHECQRKRACQDVDVKPVVRDPMDDDRVLVESGADLKPVPHEPSKFEKQKHNLIHIPFQPWCTSCVKGKAQAEPHKRTERIIDDSELVIQLDYLMLKDVAGTRWTESAQHVCEKHSDTACPQSLKHKAQQTCSQQCGQ